MFSYQQSLTSPPQPCTRERFYEIIRSADVQVRCARIQQLHEQWTAEQAKTDADPKRVQMLHDDKSALKKKLPAFIFQANFPKGRRKQAEAVLNGLYMVDFDNLQREIIEGVKGVKELSLRCAPLGVKPNEENAQTTMTADMPPHIKRLNSLTPFNSLTPDFESLGILLVHLTPSGHGLRFVAKADPERGNLADNQQWLAQQLGLPLDEACKDATRISFAFGKDSLIYINDELFTYENKDYERRFGERYRQGESSSLHSHCEERSDVAISQRTMTDGTAPREITTSEQVPPRNDDYKGGAPRNDDYGNHSSPLSPHSSLNYRGVPYSTIIAEWWRKNGGEPVEGERNQKLHRLAAHLRYICDNKEERVLAVMPTFGLSADEMKSLVHSACGGKVYNSIPKALAAVLEAVGLTKEGEREGDANIEMTRRRLREEFDRLKLPPALEAVCAGVDERLKIGAVLASMPMFFTLLSRVRFDHFDGTQSRLSGMTFIVGPAASGKSFIRDIDNILMEPIRISDQLGRKQEQDWRESREMNKNKKEQTQRPHPCIRITPIQISNTMLALRMRDAVDPHDPTQHLHVYSCETELATAIRAAKGGSWIEKNDIYCKSFHNEPWGMDYANNDAVNGEIEVNLNLVVSGTEDAFDKLIPTNTVLSGLPTRLMYFQMPEDHFKMIDKRRTFRSAAQMSLLKQTAFKLDGLGGTVNAKKLTDAMYEWCARMARRAELENDVELDDLRKRTALIGERAGIVYAILSQLDKFAEGEPLRFDAMTLRFARFIADYCLTMQYEKFAVRMREQKQRAAEYSGRKTAPMRLAHIYNALPKKFFIDDLQRLLPDASRKKLADDCYRWQKRGYIKSVERGRYEKVITIL